MMNTEPIKKKKTITYYICPFCQHEFGNTETATIHIKECRKNPVNLPTCAVCENFCYQCYYVNHLSYQKPCKDCSHKYPCRFKEKD
jgi:hypothetical protein